MALEVLRERMLGLRRFLLILATVSLLGSRAAAAEVYQVGLSGDFDTIQEAIDAALLTAEPDEIQVQQGTYGETLDLAGTLDGDGIVIEGGWNLLWTGRDPDPLLTQVDAAGLGGRALSVSIGEIAFSLTLRSLTFTHAVVGSPGAGVSVSTDGTSQVRFESCRIANNTMQSNSELVPAYGGGIYVLAKGDSVVTLHDVELADNSTLMTALPAFSGGGGGYVHAQGGQVVARRLRVTGNQVAGGGSNQGGGLYLLASGSGSVRVEDSLLSGNTESLQQSNGAAIFAGCSGACSIEILRVGVTNNTTAGGLAYQVALSTFGPDALVRFADSWIANGNRGVGAISSPGTIRLQNLTVTGHPSFGFNTDATSPAVVSVANSIAWSNGSNVFGGDTALSQNLVDLDPLFVDPSNGDFHLTAASPARDAGGTPPGGLYPYDADHAPRIAGGLPDIGAFEFGALFGDGFESGDTTVWDAD